jgi:hypothetical protein
MLKNSGIIIISSAEEILLQNLEDTKSWQNNNYVSYLGNAAN